MRTIYKESLLLSTSFVLTCAAGVTSSLYTWNNQMNGVKLSDVMHEILPDWSDTFAFPTVIFIVQYLIVLLSIKNRFKMLAQFVFLNCVVLTIRSISITATVLPNAVEKNFCAKRPDNIFEFISYMLEYGTCGDFCFSGHTSTSTLSYLTVARFGKNNFLKYLQLSLVFVMIFFLLAMRWHYSVDCLLAVIISALIFRVYYQEEREQLWYFNSCSKRVGSKVTIYDDGL